MAIQYFLHSTEQVHAAGGCLYKWHGILAGRELTEKEQQNNADVLIKWIGRQQ